MAELWDIYDEHRKRTGRLHERGKPLRRGEFHLVVNVWLLDPDGRVLLTRRHPDKHWGGYWECTGGAVLAGEDSLAGALRETEEEVGVRLDPTGGILLSRVRRGVSFLDTWLFRVPTPAPALRLQPEEVVEARWVTPDEYTALRKTGRMVRSVSDFYALLDRHTRRGAENSAPVRSRDGKPRSDTGDAPAQRQS